MADWLVTDTAVTLKVGPFLDRIDGVTPISNLAATMDVQFSKNGGTFASRASVGVITYDADGFYSVPASISDIDTLGRLKLQVTDETIHVPVWENYRVVTQAEYDLGTGAAGNLYVTAAQLASFKIDGSAVDLSDYTTDELEAEIALMGAIIDSICNDTFCTKTETYLFDGSGTPRQFFKPEVIYPLITATTVRDLDTDGSTVLDTYTEGTDFIAYDYYLELEKAVPGDSPRRRFDSGGVWPKGQQNIEIVGTWGRSATPLEIQRATLLLTLERLVSGSTNMISGDIVQASWPDFTVSIRQAPAVGASSGFDEVDRLLFNHINYINLFTVIPDKKQTFDNRLVNG